MDLKELLADKAVKKALIVDDGVDPLPFVSDLGDSQDDWTLFWDDMTKEDQAILDEVFPQNHEYDGEELITNQEFVTSVFEARERFSGAALSSVFGAYLASQEQVEKFLNSAKAILESFGLEVELVGRDFKAAAGTADIVVLDLFLGSEQTNPDRQLSIDGMKDVLSNRKETPPAIVLTSAHQDLLGLRDGFRDDIRVLASGFRTLEKKDIDVEGFLERLVFELVAHRDDVRKLSTFLGSWEASLENALNKALIEVRKLDLEDIAHLQDLLLNAEGVSVGSYMVDVMDKVLQHEIEAEQGVIVAAKALNEFEAQQFPPNSITGSKDTLSVVHRTLFAHPNRRELDEATGYPMSFGDILALRVGAEVPENPIFENNPKALFVMMTPICDLVRKRPKAKRALLLVGTWSTMDAKTINQKTTGAHTPIIILNDGSRAIVNWNLKHLETIGLDNLTQLMADNDNVYIAGRLREGAALSLQQQLLSDLGRVGEMAMMPTMFPVTCKLHYVDRSKHIALVAFEMTGVCVVGRDKISKDKSSKVAKIAFDTALRDDFKLAIESIVKKALGQSRDKVRQAISPASLDGLFTIGFVHDTIDQKAQACMIKQPKGKELDCGQVILNQNLDDRFKDPAALHDAGLIFEIHEVSANE